MAPNGTTPVEIDAKPERSRGLAGRIVRTAIEWLWRGRALRVAKQSREHSVSDRRSVVLARASAAAAERVLAEGAAPVPAGTLESTAMCLAYGLHREALLWGLRVHSGGVGKDLGAVLAATPRTSLVEIARGEEPLASLERTVFAEGTVEFASHDPATQVAVLDSAASFWRKLAATLEDRSERVERVRMQRWLRTLLALGIFTLAAAFGLQRALRPINYAAGAHWRVSSVYPGCPASGKGFVIVPACGSAFFSTAEEDEPWIEFDLGQTARISSIVVANRGDCCGERAVPLVVEASQDGKTYDELAKNPDEFIEWSTRFKPTDARFVRLRVPRKTLLHLESVEIH